MKTVYMDHHASTPVHPAVLEAMLPYFSEAFGNPASVTHGYGRRAAEAVERSREVVAGFVGCRPSEILFTSGATEANNLALRGVVRRQLERAGSAHLITCAIEHKSILDTVEDLEAPGVQVSVLPVDPQGLVDPDSVRVSLRPDTCLVSLQLANSEIGTLQRLDSIAPLCAEAGVPLHTDAAQAVGRVPVEVGALGVRLLSLSGHKIYGPKGIGALFLHRRLRLRAQITGGGQERNRRAGTLNVPAIVGLARALEIASGDAVEEAGRLRSLRDRLWDGIRTRIPDVRVNGPEMGPEVGHDEHRLPNNLNVSFRRVEGEGLLTAVKGFALSSGSACTSAEARGSYVIRALGASEEDAHSSIRFGLGRHNDESQVDGLVEELVRAVEKLRAISPGSVPTTTEPGRPHRVSV